jgi:hypothetical protein
MQALLERREVEPLAGGGRLRLTAAATSGKYRVIGRSLRLPISTSSPSRNTIERNPSHLGS